MQDIVCIASAEWPCTYYGVLQQSFDPLCADETRELGTLIMPRDVSRVARAWLVCEYEASPARPCRLDKKTVAETCCTPC